MLHGPSGCAVKLYVFLCILVPGGTVNILHVITIVFDMAHVTHCIDLKLIKWDFIFTKHIVLKGEASHFVFACTPALQITKWVKQPQWPIKRTVIYSEPATSFCTPFWKLELKVVLFLLTTFGFRQGKINFRYWICHENYIWRITTNCNGFLLEVTTWFPLHRGYKAPVMERQVWQVFWALQYPVTSFISHDTMGWG